ncbi:hypothetical protein Vadar_022206 [Vaccinium darrowii]|uniref:Uncharacterized protein n=1 Tax=Vaccinium darrowii TaxID=229202 RepID=A0ACB7ZD87_9ERIC|nr:hypothetical protein Vadar_022206 [Vaccinium darrowii]
MERKDIYSCDYKREKFELTGKYDTTIGAPDDLDDFFSSFREEPTLDLLLPASSETCDDNDGCMKQLKIAENRAILIRLNENSKLLSKAKSKEEMNWANCLING